VLWCKVITQLFTINTCNCLLPLVEHLYNLTEISNQIFAIDSSLIGLFSVDTTG